MIEGIAETRFEWRPDQVTAADLRTIANELGLEAPAGTKSVLVEFLRSWKSQQPKLQVMTELPSDFRSRLPQLTTFTSETAPNPDEEVKKVLGAQFKSLLAQPEYKEQIESLTTSFEHELNRSLAALEPFVQKYAAGIDSISVRPEFNFANGLTATPFQVHRASGGTVNLGTSGAGQRRRFSLAIYEWQLSLLQNRDETSQPLILAFDEPDTHLDYNGQRTVFDLIRKFAALPGVQVVVCTHSLNMIERVSIANIVHYKLGRIDELPASALAFPTPITKTLITTCAT